MSDRVRLSAAGPSRTTLIALHAGPARGSGSHFSPGCILRPPGGPVPSPLWDGTGGRVRLREAT